MKKGCRYAKTVQALLLVRVTLALPLIARAQMKLVPVPTAPVREVDCTSSNVDAVVVTSVAPGGMAVPCYPVADDGHWIKPTFTADDNWLDNLTITLLNRTNKTIDDLTVPFLLYQTARPGSNSMGIARVSGYNLHLGRKPEIAQVPSDRAAERARAAGIKLVKQPVWMKPLGCQPGTTIAIHFNEPQEHSPEQENAVSHAERIRRELAQILGPGKSVTELTIGGFIVTFADGMHWTGGGRYASPDFKQPMPPDYFPGDITTTWLPK